MNEIGSIIKSTWGNITIYGKVIENPFSNMNYLCVHVLLIPFAHRYPAKLIGDRILVERGDAKDLTKRDEKILFTKLL